MKAASFAGGLLCFGRRLGFAAALPGGGRARLVGSWSCRRFTRRGACLLCRLPAPPLACFPAPYPPSPLPLRGRGRPKVYFAGGYRPRHPCTKPLAALTDLAKQAPGGMACLLCHLPAPPLVCFPAPLPRRGRIDPQPALAERSSRRHLLSLPRGRGPSQTPKFLSPGPPSPWLPALPIERRFYRFCAELAIPKAHPPGAGLAGRTSAARVQSRECKGRSPLHKITLKSPPSPPGKGGGGIGGRKRS